jgi:hypothetical protein
MTEIRKSRRSTKLPQRYEVEKSPETVPRKTRSTRNLKQNQKDEPKEIRELNDGRIDE